MKPSAKKTGTIIIDRVRVHRANRAGHPLPVSARPALNKQIIDQVWAAMLKNDRERALYIALRSVGKSVDDLRVITKAAYEFVDNKEYSEKYRDLKRRVKDSKGPSKRYTFEFRLHTSDVSKIDAICGATHNSREGWITRVVRAALTGDYGPAPKLAARIAHMKAPRSDYEDMKVGCRLSPQELSALRRFAQEAYGSEKHVPLAVAGLVRVGLQDSMKVRGWARQFLNQWERSVAQIDARRTVEGERTARKLDQAAGAGFRAPVEASEEGGIMDAFYASQDRIELGLGRHLATRSGGRKRKKSLTRGARDANRQRRYDAYLKG